MKHLDIRPKIHRRDGKWQVSYVFESSANYRWIRAARRWAQAMNL